ncbi:noc2p family protein [Cystoisospora suis]|uniref:Noc2p family protein n=1 Tax=Cystoisospora suis TaxID=483139 RepID=A0A2C6LAR4_9APIC|nr:noc2p family protein [Cystoisospora suis]
MQNQVASMQRSPKKRGEMENTKKMRRLGGGTSHMSVVRNGKKNQAGGGMRAGGADKVKLRVKRKDKDFAKKKLGFVKGQKKRFSVLQYDKGERNEDELSDKNEESDLDANEESSISSAPSAKKKVHRRDRGKSSNEERVNEEYSSGFDTDEEDEEDDSDVDDDQDNYTGADWLADDDEEAWSSSSEDEDTSHDSRQTTKSLRMGVHTLEENPEVNQEFQKLLGQRLMKDKEFLDFLVKEGEKGFGESAEDGEDEEDAVSEEGAEESEDDEESSGEEKGEMTEVADEDESSEGQKKKKNLLTSERYDHLCHAAGLLPSPQQTSDGSLSAIAAPSLRSLQLILAAFRSAVRQTGVPSATPQASHSKLHSGTSELLLESNKKYKNSKTGGDHVEGSSRTRPSGSRQDSHKLQRGGTAVQKCLFVIDDEGLRHTILLRTVQGFPHLITRVLSASDENNKTTPGKASVSEGHARGQDGNDLFSLSAATQHPLWSRLKLPFRWFFSDLHQLLTTLQSLSQSAMRSKELLLQVLLATAQKTLLGLLVTIGGNLCRRALHAVARCWAFTPNQKQQLAAFAVLRQLLISQQAFLTECMVKGAGEGNKKKWGERGGDEGGRKQRAALSSAERLQHTVQLLLRAYQQAASRSIASSGGRSWRSSNRLQLLLNELQELLRVVDVNVSYRVAYQSVRELALAVRSVIVASSNLRSPTSPAKAKKSKAAFLHERRLTNAQKLLFSWPFISTARLWVSCINTLPHLKPLSFPLVSLLCASLKLKLACFPYIPFCLSVMYILQRLAEATDQLVPISAYIFAAMDLSLAQQQQLASGKYVAIQLQQRERQKRSRKQKRKLRAETKAGGGKQGGKSDQSNFHLLHVREADPEITLRLSAAQQQSMHVVESLMQDLHGLLTEHLGYLVLHPAFPEISLPIKRSLRRIMKSSRSRVVAKSLKVLLGAIETSTNAVQSLRCDMKELPVGRVQIFTEKKQKAMLPLFNMKHQVTEERRRFIEEKVSGELRAAAERRQAEEEALMTPKQLKRRRQKQRKAMEQEELRRLGEGNPSQKKKRPFSELNGTDTLGSKAQRGSVDVIHQSSKDERRERQGKLKKRRASTGRKAAPLQDDVLEELGSDLDDL